MSLTFGEPKCPGSLKTVEFHTFAKQKAAWVDVQPVKRLAPRLRRVADPEEDLTPALEASIAAIVGE